MTECIGWMEAEEKLKGYWIDSDTLPLGAKDEHSLFSQYNSVPKAAGRLIQLAMRPPGKDSPMVEKAKRFYGLTSRVRNGTSLRSAVFAACRHLGIDDTTIRDMFRVEQSTIDAVFQQRYDPWDKLDRAGRQKATARAREIYGLYQNRLSWQEAIERLGKPIDPRTIPQTLLRAVVIRKLTRSTGKRPGRPTKGQGRTPGSWQIFVVRNRYKVPRPVLLALALAESNTSEAYTRLVFGATAKEMAAARKVNLNGIPEWQREAARTVIKWTMELYDGKFPLVAESEAGEVRVGISNRHIHPPENMVLLRPVVYAVLRKWLEGQEISQINKQIPGAASIMTRVRKRFGAGTFEELSRLCEAYGLLRDGKFAGKEITHE